ncbi:hypothetical protein VTO73DRAFT_14540 [Trametes versicolor]
MENSRLPIEVCEHVIDEFFDYDWPDRKTLRASASSLDNLKKTALKIKPRLHLNTLQLGNWDNNLPHNQGYPPQGAFGSLANLTTFEFDFTTVAAVSAILKTTCTSTLSLVNSQVYLKTHTLGFNRSNLEDNTVTEAVGALQLIE